MDIIHIHQFFEKLTILPILGKAKNLKEELDNLRPIPKDDEDRIWQKFRLEWNFHSNHLEGNSLTFGETKLLILHGLTAQGKPLKDHFEVTGHNDAIDWIFDIVKREDNLTEHFIRSLHKLILKEPYEVDAITPDGKPTKKMVQIGVYKSTPNHVETETGEIFFYAEPYQTPALMEDLIKWYQEKMESSETNPIVLAAGFHYIFVRIHPFDDGNGRMSRLLMNFILMQFGYPPVVIRTEDKENYLNALRQADAGMYEPFVEYIAENLIRSLEMMLKGAKGESLEEPGDLEKELLLLENRLKNINSEIKTFRNKKNILDIRENSIRPTAKKFIIKNKIFEKFYSKLEHNLEPSGRYLYRISEYPIVEFQDTVSDNTTKIAIIYSFSNFNYTGIENINFQLAIDFLFEFDRYLVQDSVKNIFFEKPYHQQLTEAEIEDLVNAEVRRHKDFISEKIKEIEESKKEK